MTSASADPHRRVIVLTANGPAFCAGLDLKEAAAPGGAEKSAEALSRMYLAIGNSPLITIAAAAGAAMGGGAGLLAACDFVVAADDLKIAYPKVRRGSVAASVTCLLRRRLNAAPSDNSFCSASPYRQLTGVKWGLFNAIAPTARLIDEAMQLARDACAARLMDEQAAAGWSVCPTAQRRP